MLLKTCLTLILMVPFLGWADMAHAQLQRDLRDVFRSLMDELDDELKAKFAKALKDESSTVEFTPEQFERFREHPMNPFEGLDEIELDGSGSNIALKFELPGMRNRRVDQFERQSPLVLSKIQQPIQSASASTVRIIANDQQVALGIVVQTDGLILTKASEVENTKSLKCKFRDGREFEAKIVRSDSANDLAILKIESKGLAVINWSKTQVRTGAFVITPDFDGSAVALGTYSVAPRSTAAGEQAFLGVKPESTVGGVRISEIEPGTASHSAGLRDRDIITTLGGVVITDAASLVKAIRDHRPGDGIEIEYLRNGQPGKTRATLAGRSVSGEQAARFKMMNRLGAVPSRRDDNFPTVFQHDSPIFPEHCGGPVTDLEGNVLGVNIARHGRAATYAIPASHVQTILKDLMRSYLASR